MNIITKDGKDYLQTYVAKIDNKSIDASGFFTDLLECRNTILKQYNKKHKTSYSFIQPKQYGSNIQGLLNRYSADYFSPSFLKNYLTNPALCLVGSLFPEDKNAATAIGSTFHKILELYYNLPKEERDRSKLWAIKKEVMVEGQDEIKLDGFIKGFIDSGDYLGGELDDTKLECKTEHRGRAKVKVDSLNYNLPCATSFVADRIDFRDDGIYIIDYKTGKLDKKSITFDGYLGSMILYKWAIEHELGCKINGAYLMAPAIKDKFLKIPFTKANEQKMMNIVDNFYKMFLYDTRHRVYAYTDEGYFNNPHAQAFRNTMKDNTIWMAKLPVEVLIGELE